MVADLVTAAEGAASALSFFGQLAVTALVVAVTVGVGELVRRGRRTYEIHGPVWDLTLSVFVGTVSVAVIAALVVVWELTTTVERAVAQLDIGPQTGALVVLSGVVLVGAYVLTRVFGRTIRELVESSDAVTDHQREVIYRVTLVVMYSLAVVVILGLWQVNLAGLLVGAGFLGIVVGMAARQTLGAFIAGFVLMFSRPFEIGDWIRVGDQEGIVTDITVVNTRLQTFDGEFVVLPNDLVSGNEMINRSRKGRLRLTVDVGVDYDTDLKRAERVLLDALDDVEEILAVPQPRVIAREFGESAVVLGLRVWIDKPSARRKWRAQTAVITTVKSALDEADIGIPFPQRVLSERDGARWVTAEGDGTATGGARDEGANGASQDGAAAGTEAPAREDDDD